MRIDYSLLQNIIVEIQSRFSKKGKDYRLYHDGVNVLLQPFIYLDDRPYLGSKILLNTEKLRMYVRKIMDKKEEVCLKLTGNTKLDNTQVKELSNALTMYVLENRKILLDKVIIKEIRGINETKDKPFFELDFDRERAYLNYPLTRGQGDPEYIKNILDEVFLNNKQALTFIYDFIYQYVTEYRSSARATIILKGGRGMGKNVFVDILASFFGGDSVRKMDNSRFNSERLNAKVILKDESEESKEGKNNFKDLEKMAKESSGSEYQEIELKGKDKILEKTTYYLIILSNNDTVMTISEAPKDEKNNQFFVWDFEDNTEPLSSRIAKKFPDMEFYQGSGLLKKNARAFLDKYIFWNAEIIDSPAERVPYYKNCRYGIPVPITSAELELVESTKTKADRSFEMLVELITAQEIRSTALEANDIHELFTVSDTKGRVFLATKIINSASKDNNSLETSLNIKSVVKYCKNYNIKCEPNKAKRFRPNGSLTRQMVKGVYLDGKDLERVFKGINYKLKKSDVIYDADEEMGGGINE